MNPPYGAASWRGWIYFIEIFKRLVLITFSRNQLSSVNLCNYEPILMNFIRHFKLRTINFQQPRFNLNHNIQIFSDRGRTIHFLPHVQLQMISETVHILATHGETRSDKMQTENHFESVQDKMKDIKIMLC